jgi:hypothetical protein
MYSWDIHTSRFQYIWDVRQIATFWLAAEDAAAAPAKAQLLDTKAARAKNAGGLRSAGNTAMGGSHPDVGQHVITGSARRYQRRPAGVSTQHDPEPSAATIGSQENTAYQLKTVQGLDSGPLRGFVDP